MAASTAKTETEAPKVPHVYTAIGAILNALKVEKNGTLPGNMGGKPYITAVDVSQEVKRQFVDNGLIFVPSEEMLKHEVIQFKERLNIAVIITGTYEIISTQDGSSVTISGTGDGLATGTAVASNIASTNALKNALLRFFLITEQSVEDEAKNGAADAPERAAAPNRAAQTVAKAQAAKAPAKTENPKDIIRVEYIEPGKITKEQVNTAIAAHQSEGATVSQALVKILGDLRAGKDL